MDDAGQAARFPIVACIDGSDHSARVCEYAAWLSAQAGRAVDLLHLDEQSSERARSRDGEDRLDSYIRDRGRRLMHDAAARVVEAGGDLADLVVGQGPLIEIVARLASAASALVIGQRGRSSPRHSARLGANVLAITARAAAPVCLAPAASRRLATALIVLDASSPDHALARFVGSHPCLDGLDCRLVGYGEPCGDAPSTPLGATPADAVQAFLEGDDFDLLVLPRRALLAHARRRELEGLITTLERPVILPPQGGDVVETTLRAGSGQA